MKKIINIITLPVFILLPFYLQAHLSMAYDNPAYPLDCNWELIIPAVNFIADMDNSLISLDNLSIFDKDRYDNGHIMSDEEKEILTAGDLVLSGAFAFDILGVRYRQWGLKLKALAYFKGKILDKQYTEIALYGNETNKIYHFNAGKGAKGYGFFKAALNYNYPHAFDLVKLFFKSSSSDLEIPTYLGMNINLYRSEYMAVMDKSVQEFGSLADSLFYNYEALYHYTDDKSNGKMSLGFGLGFITMLPRGLFSLQIDDIFGKLDFENVAGGEYKGVYSDLLLYFHADDYEPFDESLENDSLRVKKKSISIGPTIRAALRYDLYRNLNGQLQFLKSDYEYPTGFSLSLDYSVADKFPFQITLGKDENTYFSFLGGLRFPKVEYLVSFTFYHGFFNFSRGLGISSMLKIKL